MKYLIGILFTFFCFSNLVSQVTVTTDLPANVQKNKEILVNITFNKGPVKNYSKYELNVPSDITIKEVDSKYGAFSFENNKLRIIWAITPADPVYNVKVNFIIGNETGNRQLTQTYAYAEKGQKVELEMAKINFTIRDSASIGQLLADTIKVVENNESLTLSANGDINSSSNENNTQNTEATQQNQEANQQTAETNAGSQNTESSTLTINSEGNLNAEVKVSVNEESKPANTDNTSAATDNKEITEVKKDASEAENIGNAEKANAEIKIAEAKIEMQKADSITDLEKKKEAIELANQNKRKAEEDLANADRILVLSKSINENAKQIESLNQPADSTTKVTSPSETTVSVAVNTNTQTVKVEKAKENAMNKGEKDAKDLYKTISPEDHHNDPEIAMQVSQLRLDSRDAKEVGTREKLKAEQSLHDAYDALKKTKYIPDAEEKKLAIEKANADIEQAKADLEIASKILTLSKSLEENAKEIERLHLTEETKTAVASTTQSSKPAKEVISLNKPKANASAPKAEVQNTTPTETKIASKTEKTESSKSNTKKPSEKPVESAKPNKTVESKEVIASENNVAPSNPNAAFTLQLGSFVNNPDMSVFKKLGKVDLRNENGRYKVYYGQFNSKQEASEMRQQTVAKGFDCFVVTIKK